MGLRKLSLMLIVHGMLMIINSLFRESRNYRIRMVCLL